MLRFAALFSPTGYPGFSTQQEGGGEHLSGKIQLSAQQRALLYTWPGVGCSAGIPCGNHIALDLDVLCAHGPGPPTQGTSPGLCPGGCKTICGEADPAAKWSKRCPGSHRSLGALGTAQWFEAISWCSLGFRVFNLVHHWVLPADSTKVWAKPPPAWGTLA